MKNTILNAALLSCIALASGAAPADNFVVPDAGSKTNISTDIKTVAPTNLGSADAGVSGPAFVPAPRPMWKNWMSRHEKFVAEAKKGRIDILFLGDSITELWQSRGANVWNKYYASRRVADFGIGADHTQNLLWRIENGELDGIHPKVTVLLIGTNNTDKDSPEDIARAIKNIIGVIRAKLPETKILLLAIFPRGPRGNGDKAVADAATRMNVICATNKLISKFADGETVKYLDIGARFLGPDGKIPDDIMPGQLHPSEKGYQIWADAMNPTLNEMLEQHRK